MKKNVKKRYKIHTQLSPIKFLPWILTASFHSVLICWLLYNRHVIETTGSFPQEKILKEDLTFWNWTLGVLVLAFIITPQFLVLAAVVKVCRYSK